MAEDTDSVEFNFVPDEYVLCFEPDMTKARVLYNAKILQTVSYKDKHKTSVPGYRIHFQGWNSSWDRIVPEAYILKNTHENRQLMKRLAEVARTIKQNGLRKKRIDIILRQYFNKRHLFDSETESDGEDLSGLENLDGFHNGIDTNGLGGSAEDSSDSEISFDSNTEEQEENDSGDESSDQTDEDDEFIKKNVELEIPDVLKTKLEMDFMNVNKYGKLHKLPASSNVVGVLESYVRQFGVNMMCGAHERPRARSEPYPPPERNIEMCKETVDGIRTMFDVTLPKLLLYNSERAQYDEVCGYPPTEEQMKQEEKMLTEDSGAESRQSEGLPSEIKTNSSPAQEDHIKQETQGMSDGSDGDEEIVCRRMTRHSYQEEIRRNMDSKTTTKEGKETDEKPVTKEHTPVEIKPVKPEAKQKSHGSYKKRGKTRNSKRRESLRSAAIATSISIATGSSANGEAATACDNVTDRVTPPPPLLLPNNGSCSPKYTSTRSHCSTSTTSGPTEKESLENLLYWKLMPDDLYQGKVKPPCLIYGVTHLLRLFVRLPGLLSEMAFKEAKLQALIKHLILFLDYLKEFHETLFADSQYIDNKDN